MTMEGPAKEDWQRAGAVEAGRIAEDCTNDSGSR